MDKFPNASQTAQIIFEAATGGKDQIDYPTDSFCQKLYDEYKSMDVKDFKIYLYKKFFEA